MAQTGSTTEKFERILGDARADLSSTRKAYSQLETATSIPEWVIRSLGDLSDEIDELDTLLEVTHEDLELAKRTARRTSLLKKILSAYKERQRTIAESDIQRTRVLLSGVTEVVRQHGLEGDCDPSIKELERQQSMLEKLVESGRYGQVLQTGRFSPKTLEDSTRELDAKVADQVAEPERVRSHIDIIEILLELIHDSLSKLKSENEEKTTYADDLQMIKSEITAVEAKIDKRDSTVVDDTTHTTLDECLNIHHSITRAIGNQRLAFELADALDQSAIDTESDVETCVVEGDVETLLKELEAVVDTGSELSTAKRLQRLLGEHDGSIVRTANATEFTVETIIQHLPRLLQDCEISDIHVVIDE